METCIPDEGTSGQGLRCVSLSYSLSCEADLPRFSDHIEVRISTFGELVSRVITQSAVGSLAVILLAPTRYLFLASARFRNREPIKTFR
jgi:hypothetical protein